MPDPSKIHPKLADRVKTHLLAATGLPPPIAIIVKYRAGAVGVADTVEGVTSTQHVFRLIPAAAHTATPAASMVMS